MQARRRTFLLCLCLVGLVSLGTGRSGVGESAKIKVLLVTGHDVSAHNWKATTAKLRAILEEGGVFDVRVVEDTGIFESSTLSRYDVIVNNFGHASAPPLTERAKQGLLDFVKSGKGLVSLHFACNSFQDWDEYKSLIGRIWKTGVGGHGRRGTFTVEIKKPDHPIVAGVADFEMDDELYAKLTGDAEIEVLATAKSDWSGQVEPIVFTLSYGKGRVVQNVLGHDVAAQESPAYQALIRRGTEWAATGKVTVK